MHKRNWDDLRFMLAVAENGSVSAAARVLGVNHATVLRRIAAFEARHGREVFARTPQGYTLPNEHKDVIEAARAVEAAVFSLERVMKGVPSPLSGTVRVTSTDTFCQAVLPQILAHPPGAATDLRIELICSNSHLDLARLDADVAVKPTDTLQEGLVGSIEAELGFCVYGDPALPWLGLSGALSRSRPAEWLRTHVGDDQLAATADSFLILHAMVAAKMGKAVLPCVLGDRAPHLEKLDGVMPPMRVPIWVTCHADMAEVPRIHAIRTLLKEGCTDKPQPCAGHSQETAPTPAEGAAQKVT